MLPFIRHSVSTSYITSKLSICFNKVVHESGAFLFHKFNLEFVSISDKGENSNKRSKGLQISDSSNEETSPASKRKLAIQGTYNEPRHVRNGSFS